MAKTAKKNEKILENFFIEAYDIFDYYTDIKIDEIIKKKSHSGLSAKEYKALQKLTATKTGREALKKVLVDYGQDNFFSTLVYIDGARGVKDVELVNADTGEPLAEDMLHEYLSSFNPAQNSLTL
jgi:hypothetical protein